MQVEEHVAAVIVEPIQGEGGFIVPAPGFLRMVADWCSENGVVFIADEVQTGFCRTGDWFACEHEGIVPDLVTTAKALAGGAAAGRAHRAGRDDGCAGRGRPRWRFGGNPISCAAALMTIQMMKDQDLPGAARRIGTQVGARLDRLAAAFLQVGEVRGRGAMMAIEIVHTDGLKIWTPLSPRP